MNKTVLIADDSIATQRLFEMALTKEGFQVIAVGSGADALDYVRQEKPDIALIDAIMPDLDGYQICKTLKRNRELGNLPVVLLAGTFEDFDEEKGQQAGADAILNKPCKPDVLVSKVKELLQAKKSKSTSEARVRLKPTPPTKLAAPKAKTPLATPKQLLEEDASIPTDEQEIVREVRMTAEQQLLEEEFAEEDLEVLEEEFPLEEEVGGEETLEPTDDMISEVVQEPASVEEEFEFDEPKTDYTVEEEILEEVFQEEEVVEELSPEEELGIEEVTPPAPVSKVQATPSSSQKADLIADQIAEKVAGKLLPLLTQELANYLIKLPIMEHLIRNMSQRLVEEILPELERKE